MRGTGALFHLAPVLLCREGKGRRGMKEGTDCANLLREGRGHGATVLEPLCLTLSAALRLVEKEEERGRVMAAVASACGEVWSFVFLEGCGFSCSSCGTAREQGGKRARGHMAAYHGAGCMSDAGGWAGNRNGVML